MMFWYGSHLTLWQAGLMWVGMVAFWGVLIWAVYALITAKFHRPDGSDPLRGDDPRRILDERLAHGDIDPGEYHRLLDVLGSGRPGTRPMPGARQ
jgi:putative membrane protein